MQPQPDTPRDISSFTHEEPISEKKEKKAVKKAVKRVETGSFTARTVEMVLKEDKKPVKALKKGKITILREPQGVKKGSTTILATDVNSSRGLHKGSLVIPEKHMFGVLQMP